MVDSRRPNGLPSKDSWRTPLPVLFSLEEQLGINYQVDPCAAPDNHLGFPFFYTETDDGLKQDWSFNGSFSNVFVNPPFSKKKQFVEKAYSESQKEGMIVDMLLPNCIDTDLFHDILCFAQFFPIRGRIEFWGDDLKPVGSPREGHSIFRFTSNKTRRLPSLSVRGL